MEEEEENGEAETVVLVQPRRKRLPISEIAGSRGYRSSPELFTTRRRPVCTLLQIDVTMDDAMAFHLPRHG